MQIIQAKLSCPDSRIAIAISRFNNFININLLNGAIDILKRIGNIKEKNITVVWLPGAYELPIIVNELSQTNKYEAIIALGTIIRGETSHFKFVSIESSKSLSNIILKNKIPVSFGILSTNNINQAIDRAGNKLGNYGSQAAMTALEMINLLKLIRSIKKE